MRQRRDNQAALNHAGRVSQRVEPDEADEYLRMTDVSGILRCSRSRVYQMLEDGTLPYIRLGKMLRVSRRSLTEMLRSHTHSAV